VNAEQEKALTESESAGGLNEKKHGMLKKCSPSSSQEGDEIREQVIT